MDFGHWWRVQREANSNEIGRACPPALRAARPESLQRQFRLEQRNMAFGALSNVAIPGASPRYRVIGRGVKVVRRGAEFQVAAPTGQGALPAGGEEVVNWALELDHFSLSDLAEALPEVGEQKLLEITQLLTSIGVLEAL